MTVSDSLSMRLRHRMQFQHFDDIESIAKLGNRPGEKAILCIGQYHVDIT